MIHPWEKHIWQLLGTTLMYVLLALMLPRVTAAPVHALQAAAAARTDVCGNIDASTTWTVSGSPYVVTCDRIYIRPGVTLTIASGVVVKFQQGDGQIYVDGGLEARGAAEQPIIFTSYKDDSADGDTNADGSATTPAPGDWNELHFGALGSGALEHAVVRYGGKSYGYSVYVNTPRLTVSDSTFAHGNGRGIYFESVMPPTLARNHFIDNSGAAVQLTMRGAPSFVLEGNQATGNDINGFVLANVQVEGDIIWNGDPGLPFVVDDFSVSRGGRLTLSPGDIVKFRPDRVLSVAGALIARGAVQQPIVFTSLRDDTAGGDTNGDGNATLPAPGDWNNLRFEYAAPVSGNVLEHVIVRYGGQYWHENIYVNNTDLTLINVTSSHANGSGLSLNGATALVRASAFTNNSVGVWVGGNSNVIITESRIENNRDFGIQNYSAPKLVDARYNWWGHATGPQHTSLNPGGQGNGVSDGVLFTPWYEQPSGSPVQRVIFQIRGPRSATPGDSLDFLIDYYTSYAIDDAVLLFSIPNGSDFVAASNGGQYFASSGQVYWQLGDLPAGTQSSVSATVQSLWGLPAGFPDATAVMMGGSNLQIAPYSIDTTPYTSHTPVRVTGSSQLSSAQINSALQASADLNALYGKFIGEGFTRLGGTLLTSSDGHQITQVILVHPQAHSLVDLRRDQTSNEVTAITFADDVVTVTDRNGSVKFDLLQNTSSGAGLWAEAGLFGEASVNPNAPSVDEIRPFTCFRNCALKETGMWAIKKLSSTVKAVLAMRGCLQAIGGDPTAVDTCVGLFTNKVSETVPGFSEVKAFTKCLSECVNPDTRQKHVCTGPLTTVELPTWSWLNPASWTEGGRKRQYIVYECNSSTGMWTTANILYCPRGFVAQKGADDGFGRPCVPANEDVAFAYGYDERKVPSASSPVTLNVAKDPNAKFGIYAAAQAAVLPGQTLVYTITCENEGSGTAYGVYILDSLSPNLDENRFDLGGQGQYSAALRQVSWDIGDLAPKGAAGSTATVSFTIKPKTGLPAGAQILNQALVYFPSVPEVTPTNLVVNTIQPAAAIPQTVQAVSGIAKPITLQGKGSGALSYSIVHAPFYGVLSGAPPNVSYTASAGYSGNDFFTYRVTSGGQQSVPAQVQLNVSLNPADATPLAVLWVSPANGATLPMPKPASFTDTLGVGYYPLLTIQFSRPLQAATVSNASVVLKIGEQPVNTTVGFVAGLNQVTLIPRQAMTRDGVYTLSVTTDVKDVNGKALAAPLTATFTLGERATEEHNVYLPLVNK